MLAPDWAEPSGDDVIVDGLSSKPELNGSRGIAVGFDEDKGRYTVRLDAGRPWR